MESQEKPERGIRLLWKRILKVSIQLRILSVPEKNNETRHHHKPWPGVSNCDPCAPGLTERLHTNHAGVCGCTCSVSPVSLLLTGMLSGHWKRREKGQRKSLAPCDLAPSCACSLRGLESLLSQHPCALLTVSRPTAGPHVQAWAFDSARNTT